MADDVKGTYTYEYPRPAMTADCVVFGFDGNDLKVLLIERGLEPFGWAFPGGFMRMSETIEECAKRELEEETGLETTRLEQFHIFSDINRDPRYKDENRVVTTAFYALVKMEEVKGGDDAKDAKWFPIKKIPHLVFDHDYILRIALQTLKEKIHFQPIGFELMGDEFTMTELQNLYEAILEVKFDRRNFYKKITQLELLEDIDKDNFITEPMANYSLPQINSCTLIKRNIDCLWETPREKSNAGRKPVLYRFNKKKYEELKQPGKFKIEF